MRVQTVAAAILVVMMVSVISPGCIDDGNNRPPRAIFETTVSAADVGDVIIFDATNSTDEDGRITSFHWDFGDHSEQMGPTVHHSYNQHGVFNVTLTVTDDLGKKSIFVQTIIVNAPPVALIDATPDVQVIGDGITFSAERSNDLDGSLVSTLWDFGDGNSSSARVVEHTYADVGSYMVTLTVSDNRGAQASDTMFVRVVLRTFDVNFTARGANLDNVREYTAEGSVNQLNSTIDVHNLHMVKFRLTWRDNMKPPGGDPNDKFRLTVTPPDGFSMTANGSSEDLLLIFPLASIPINRTMDGRDEGAVHAAVVEQMGSSLGKGVWLIHIEAVECGGFWENNEYNADLGNYWDLAVHYDYFDITVTATR